MEKQHELLVKVQNVSKKFSYNLKNSLKYGAVDIFRSTLGLKTEKKLRPNEFWAVNDISFELKRGECIGLIGHNGAGKSTLLKILNGLYAPDKGQITMKGKVGALIELGAGFNPILTGRENIFNNAAVLGFTKEEVEEKMQSIIDFSEIGEFLDMPVKNYSSGMNVRLGFAVAVHLQPDILIVDEVLAVGDLGFILKCFKKIDELLPHTAVIFVSHSMPMVSRICNEIILMNKGRVQYQGTDVAKGIDEYYNHFSSEDASVVFDDGSLELIDYKIKNTEGTVEKSFEWNSSFIVDLTFRNKTLTKMPYVTIQIMDKEQRAAADIHVDHLEPVIKPGKDFSVRFVNKDIKLSKGRYTLNVLVSETSQLNPIYRMNNALEFFMTYEKEVWAPFMLKSEISMIN